MKTYVGNQIATVQQDFGSEVFTLAAQDITNGYVTLAQNPIAASLHVFPVGGLPQEPAVDYAVDGVVLNRLNFLGDLAAQLVAGDKLVVKYAY